MTKHIRLAVTGLTGQVVSALIARAPKNLEIIALGRPQLELGRRNSVLASLKAAGCDAIVNAAAYTSVDKAEREPETAKRVNGEGAGFVAEAASMLKVPLIHFSTDYVFDGQLDRPYKENDPTRPLGAYGCSKLEGERRVAEIHPNHVILRTAWVYSPYGVNFVKTMLRLGETNKDVEVVCDQIGNPTSALDIAEAVISISRKVIVDNSPELRGIFHITGKGEATWAELASSVFEVARNQRKSSINVIPITSAKYFSTVIRPANSRLNCDKLNSIYGISLPNWQHSINVCVQQLLKNE